jgi:uncharacterized protein (DUF342 family)
MDIDISVAPDKMEAYLVVRNIFPGEEVTLDKLVEAIKEAKIIYGIDYDALRLFCESPTENVPLIFAHGDKPKDGEDGRIVFEVREKKATEVYSSNKIDFREFPVQKRIIVKKGQKIAAIYPPTDGVPGKNVYGEIVPARRGNEAKVILAKNVALGDDGHSIISTTDGILKVDVEKNVIEVSEYLEIDGDVDYETGNIDFPGIVLIKGDVKPGFVVRAKGDIEIVGVLEAAAAISLEGNVKVSGAKGKDKGFIKAKRDVHVKYAESITIEAENLFFEHSLLNCTVRVTKSIVGTGRNSSIVAGEYIAANLIEADEIGSDIGTKTYLEVGVNPYLREEIKLLRAQIEVDRTSIQKLIAIVKQYKELKGRGVAIPQEREEQFSKAAKALINLRDQVEKNIAKLNELEQKLTTMSFNSKIVARKLLHAGVEVTIHNNRFYSTVDLAKVVLRFDGEKVVAGGYSEEGRS